MVLLKGGNKELHIEPLEGGVEERRRKGTTHYEGKKTEDN
jgi:hypothetical protein